MKAPSDNSPSQRSGATQENSLGETTWPPGRASLRDRILLWWAGPQGLVVLCILWPLCLLAVVFAYILLI